VSLSINIENKTHRSTLSGTAIRLSAGILALGLRSVLTHAFAQGEAASIILQMDAATVHEKVVEYYGKDIKTTADLKTSACLTVRV